MIDGEKRRALIDTGCSLTLIGERVAGTRCRDRYAVASMEMMNGDAFLTDGAVTLSSVLTDQRVELGPLQAHVLPKITAPS